jgi:hypothetical protein
MDVIEDLIKKRKDLFKQVEAIDTVLKIYGVNVLDNKFLSNDAEINVGDDATKIFPIKSKPATQVLWLFKNSIKHSIKLKEVQELFNKYSGSNDKRIDNVARRLKRDKKLVIVKYNEKNLLSFWGLPEWVGENDFKQEFKPEEESLPDEILNSEVVTGE